LLLIRPFSLNFSKESPVVALFGLFLYYALAMATKVISKEKEIAVIETGGKQYVVSVGDTIEVELLSPLGALTEGDVVTFDKVLLVDNGSDTTIGTPYITGAKVTGRFVADTKAPKISILRYKAKSNRDRKIGHRQKHTKVTIEKLS
jgi:large subunit ribosomal protein L21